MQIFDLDFRTRIALVNITAVIFRSYLSCNPTDIMNNKLKRLMMDVYCTDVSGISYYDPNTVLSTICDTIREDSYDAVLSVIEYFANTFESKYEPLITAAANHKNYNKVFEIEYVGYRFVASFITSITNETEISEIEEAASSPYSEVNNHFDKAIRLLSDRTVPDYENSIKESISAVERMCSIIIGKSTTLGAALDKLIASGLHIHPAMKAAFDKLYGYTSDGSAIRHSGQLGGPDSTFEEAKFMLVSCCAFVNYLIGALAKHPN